MTKNPIVNALLSVAYIALVVSLIFNAPKFEHEPTVLVPIAMLSLFCLSAATMGYLFLSKPLQMYLDGDKKPAVKLFVHTLLSFGVITISVFAVILAMM